MSALFFITHVVIKNDEGLKKWGRGGCYLTTEKNKANPPPPLRLTSICSKIYSFYIKLEFLYKIITHMNYRGAIT